MNEQFVAIKFNDADKYVLLQNYEFTFKTKPNIGYIMLAT